MDGTRLGKIEVDSTLSELRQRAVDDFQTRLGEFRVDRQDNEFCVYVTPSRSRDLRQRLAKLEMTVVAMDRESLSKNIIAGWAFAPNRLCQQRRDLVLAYGIRILETVDGDAETTANILDFTEPVDLVYTWVDGSDPEWLRAREIHNESTDEQQLPSADSAARFTSNDELRYSLRSVDAFLPWVRKIYIVTAGQIPLWIDKENEKIEFVDHRELFGKPEDLPTFNSHAIESQIHHIPGLAEHFLYVNDDCLFGQPMHKNTFFTPHGYSIFFPSEKSYELEISNRLPINLAASNNAKLIRDEFGLNATLKFKHVAHPQRRSVLRTIEKNHSALIAETAAAKFRSSSDLSIPSALAHYYGVALGTAVAGDLSYKYIDMGHPDAQLKLARLLWSDRPQVMCLNQVSGSQVELVQQGKSLRHFLKYAFPWKSTFEC